MSLQAQPPTDVGTTQITTAVSCDESDSASHQDRARNVTRVVQEVVTRRRRTLSLKDPSLVSTDVHV